MFSPKVIQDYYQLTWDNITPIPGDFNWDEVVEILLGRQNAWLLPITEWHQIELTPSIAILWLFMCHNIKSTSHRTTFTDPTAGFIYHLVWENKIDLTTLCYNQIHHMGTLGDWHNSMIFPSLISGICMVASVNIAPGEKPSKPSTIIKRSTLEAQDRARIKHREKQEDERRRQQDEQG